MFREHQRRLGTRSVESKRDGWEMGLGGKGSSVARAAGRVAQFVVQAGGLEFALTYNPSWEVEVERVTLGVAHFPQSLSMLFWGGASSWTWSSVLGSQTSQLAPGTTDLCLLYTGMACRPSVPTQLFVWFLGVQTFRFQSPKLVLCLLSHLLGSWIN